jgi:protein transport protein SEC23
VSPTKGASAANRFILPVSDCEFTLAGALEELQRDGFPAVAAHRPSRCTGTALQVATALLGGCLPAGASAARVMLFCGGPATEGPGKVWRALGTGWACFARSFPTLPGTIR